MEILEDHSHLGLEFDWMGVDDLGRLGYFSTAGRGPIPKPVSTESAYWESIFEKVMKLKEVSNHELLHTWDGDIGDWVKIAKRGIFAFDWNFEKDIYELVAHPSHPTNIETIDFDSKDKIMDVRLKTCFSSSTPFISLQVSLQ